MQKRSADYIIQWKSPETVEVSGLFHIYFPKLWYKTTAAFTLDVYGHVSEKMKEDSAARMQQYIENMA